MSNFHRLIWIDACIRKGGYPNRTIAGQFEISIRQAQRDVEYLRDSMGAPVGYSSSRNGYYYTDETFVLPSGFITGEDRTVLSYLAGKYGMAGGERAAQLAELFTRLGGGRNDSIQGSRTLPVFEADRAQAAVFNLLLKASSGRSKVRMIYRSARDESTVRVFHPYKLFNKNKTDYAAGYCELRKEIRIFRLSRIAEPELLPENFEISPLFNEEDYSPETGFKYKEPYHALVEFDSPPRPDAFRFKIAVDSGNLYRISFDSSEEILSALLSCKRGFRLRHPNWLKERLRERLEKIMMSNFGSDIICRTHSV
jgi:predicted DNA-binding transcriptional regulator YafY